MGSLADEVPSPPLYGFRVGEIVRFDRGGTWTRTRFRVVGPRENGAISVAPVGQDERKGEEVLTSIRESDAPGVGIWDLMHDTPAYHAWVAIGERVDDLLYHGHPAPPDFRIATEALIADNPHLLVPRVSWEGGKPHSMAACLRRHVLIEEVGSAARLEAAVRTVVDPEVLECVRAWADRMARSSERNEPMLSDEDRLILARVAAALRG